MKKSIKVLAILSVVLLFTLNICLATDINMNLDPMQNSAYLSDAESQYTIYESNAITDNNTNIDSESTLTNTPSTTISTLSSVPDETLSLTNILNILLIVVGVVLILLGIAILIRMHS